MAAGLGVGCGVGIGFGQPFNLGSVPAIGQAIAGMNSGLGQVSGSLGGAGAGVREAVRRLGIKGLDAGLGCGVGVGYGFGAGLFLKPSAAEELVRLVEDAAGSLSRHAQATLHQAGIQLPGAASRPAPQEQASPFAQGVTQQQLPPLRTGIGNSTNGNDAYHPMCPGPPLQQRSTHPPDIAVFGPSTVANRQPELESMPTQHSQPQPQSQPQLRVNQSEELGTGGGDPQAVPHAAATLPVTPQTGPAATAASQMAAAIVAREPSAEEFRALLRHERQIARLRAQNRALRSAVCKLDRRLPVCKETSDDDEG